MFHRKGHFVQLLILITGLITAAGVFSQTAEPTVSDIQIEITEVTGDVSRWRDIADSYIFLKKGRPFSAEMFQQSIEALTNSKLFREIEVPDPDWNQPELSFTFRLAPFQRIKDIQISGAFPMFEKEVLNAMSVYAGDAFIADKIPQYSEAVIRLFKLQGYISPKVDIQKEPVEDHHYVILHVDIQKGDYYKIDRMTVEGNQSFSDFRLRLRTDTWKASFFPLGIDRFVAKDLDADIRNLIEFYREQGFPEVKITADVQKNEETRDTVLALTIHEGPKYDVDFEGNEEYWDMTLKKDLVFYKEGNKNDFSLKKSTRNIRKRYRADGYLRVKVRMEDERIEEDDRPVRKIVFNIDEGVQSVVRSITIKNNEAVDKDDIEDQMLTRTPGILADGAFDPKKLEEDIDAVNSVYLKRGYREAEIEKDIEWQEPDEEENQRLADLTLSVDEGVQTLISSVEIKGLSAVPVEDALDAIVMKPGDPYREYMIKEDEIVIAALDAEKGHPHVTVKGTPTVSKDGTKASIVYEVTEGPYVKMGNVYVTGNFKTLDRIFKEELEMEPGDPFSAKKLLESRRNIQNLEAVDSVNFNIVGLQEKQDAVDLIVKVEEKKPYYFQIGGGYDTERHLFLSLKGGDRNLFGANKLLEGSAEISQIGYRADVSFTEPRFFKSRISSTTKLFAEQREEFNKEFGIRNYGASQAFSRKLWDDKLTLGMAFRYEYRDQYMIDDAPIPEGEEDQYEARNVVVATPSAIYNSTDSYTRPTKGLYSSAYFDYSKGIDDDIDNFFKYRLEARYYYTPLKRLTFAMRGKYGFIDPYGSNTGVPDDQLFFLGGTSDVRGFDENKLRVGLDGNALGGRESILGNLEARIDMGYNVELAAFYDIGSLRETQSEGGTDDFRSSAGLGLRYITPIGAVGFLYGWKLDKEEGESDGKLHFSIGYTF